MRHNCSLHETRSPVEEIVGDRRNDESAESQTYRAGIVVLGLVLGGDLMLGISAKLITWIWCEFILPLVTRPPPLPGSSTSIFDSLGVFDPSPSVSLAPLATSARAEGG